MKFAEVILPIPSDARFIYSVSEDMNVQKGMRVVVPLGASGRKVTGYVTAVNDSNPDTGYEIKSIIKTLDLEPVFDDSVLVLADFVASNYACSAGEAFDAILPSAKSSGESVEFSEPEETGIELSEEQKIVFENINSAPGIHLISGITGSGKTELYLKLAESVIASGGSVIFLLPEISLSWQIFSRVKSVFGDQAVLYHSALTPKEKMKSWLSFYKGSAKIAVGTRSAVFMQSAALSMIIIDEEHDASYKEHSVPRYNAKRIALHRMRECSGKLILGSATPSAESYYSAKTGVIKMHVLNRRFFNADPPQIETETIPEKSILSNRLKNAVFEAAAAGKQSVLLLNRRGYSPTVQCSSCGQSLICPDCSVNTAYHKKGALVCHYCGNEYSVPENCPSCGGELKFIGSGTQKAEDIISSEFKTLNVFRLDQDSARKKSTVPEMMKKMNSSQIDILLGTQMISKGFDFPDLSFAGVINADIGLGVPDFRSSERVYSLLTQLAGRCGRRGDRGKVIIQTRDPMNPIFSFLRNNDYAGFMEREISIRKALAYPPFSFLMRLIIKDPDERKAAERSFEIEAFLDANIPKDVDVLGPAPAPIEKIGKNYRYHFILKSRTRSSLLLTASKLRQVKNLKADIDIDPSDMM